MKKLKRKQTAKVPVQSGWAKDPEEQHSARVVVLLRPREFRVLSDLADGEPLGTYGRRIFRDHFKHLVAQGKPKRSVTAHNVHALASDT